MTTASIAYPEVNDSENIHAGNFKPVQLPTAQPKLSDAALLCLQSFANATGMSLDQVASEAVLYWWDTNAGIVVKHLEREAE